MRGDVVGGPALPRAHNLVLVEEEDRNPCRGEEFVDLGAPGGAELLARVAVDGGLAQAVASSRMRQSRLFGSAVMNELK